MIGCDKEGSIRVFNSRTILKGFLLGILVVLLLVGAGLAFLQTGIAKSLLSEKLAAVLSSGPDRQVSVGRIQGFLPVHLRVNRIRVRDRRGVWLSMDGLVLRWSPLALLQGKIRIAELSAARVTVIRLPQSAPAKPGSPGGAEQWSRSIAALNVADLHIAMLRLGTAVVGRAADFRLQGKVLATAADAGLKATLELQRLDAGPLTRLHAELVLQGNPTRVGMHADFQEAAGGWVAQILGLEAEGPLQASINGEGPLDRWQGVVACRAGRWGTLHSGLELHYGRQISLALQGKYTPGSHLVPHPWQALLGPQAILDLQVDMVPSRSLRVKKLQMRSAGYQLDAAAGLDLRDQTLQSQFQLTIKDLQRLKELLGESVPGTARLEVHMTGQGRGPSGPSVAGRIEGFLRPAATAPLPVSSILGPELKFSTDFDLQKGKLLTVSNLHAGSKAFQLTSRAQMNLAAKTLHGAWQLLVPQLKPLGLVVGKPMGGSLRAEGTVGGALDSLQAAVRLQGREVRYGKMILERALLSLKAKNVPAAPQGDLRLELVQQKARLLLTSRFFQDRQRLGFAALHMQGPGIELQGDLKVDLRSILLQGELTGRLHDLSALGRFTGQELSGSGALQARFQTVRGRQDAELHVNGKRVHTPFGGIGQLRLLANLKDLLGKPRGLVDLQLSGLQSSTTELASLTLRVTGDEQGMHFRGRAKGHIGSAFELQTQGVAVHGKAGDRLEVQMLRGRLGGFPVKLLRSASFERTGERMNVTGLDVAFGTGRLQGSGRLAARRVKLDLIVKQWPLQAAALFGGPELHGTAAGRLQVSGAAASPELQLQLDVTGLRGSTPALQALPPATVVARAWLQKHLLRLQASLQGPFAQPAQLALQMPLNLSLTPFAFAVPADGALRGHLSAQLDLLNVNRMLPWDGQALTSGQASVNLDIGGRLVAPRVSGRVTVRDGGYENYVSGTVLRALQVEIQARGSRLEISNVQATDAGRGRLSGSGWVKLDAAEHFPMDLKLSFDQAALVRRDDVTGTATGQLELSGSLRELAVTGRLDVMPVEVYIPDRLPAEMTELDVIEIHGERGTSTVAAKPAVRSSPPVPIRLNLELNLPRRIFVRGRGLDSEWGGKLRVAGTLQEPVITGNMSVVRGRFNFLNRRFKLTTGKITFYGGSPPSPSLNLTAESEVQDMTARLVLSGSVSNPQLELQSTPPLASDEILARLLFRRSTAQLTPTQALKLAAALQRLTGTGSGGLSLVDRTRRFLGLDALEFESSEGGLGAGTVGVGKYLSDNVYLNLQKGIGEKTDKASVEVEITPHISVESQVQSNASSGIGVNWKYDY